MIYVTFLEECASAPGAAGPPTRFSPDEAT